MRVRGSGILLHITCLPSSYGIGDLGPTAYRFADLLAENHQCFWQVLPLGPTDPICGNTPYDSRSIYAGNPLLISPEILVRNGLISNEDLEDRPSFPESSVDYPSAMQYKNRILKIAYESFQDDKGKDKAIKDFASPNKCSYRKFCSDNAFWLDDFALFSAIKSHFGGRIWNEWPEGLRNRNSEALGEMKRELRENIWMHNFLQYIFFQQWTGLKSYCTSKSIQIIGDMPIYVNYDSSDVWTRPDIFTLDDNKRPETIAGVPPDYFSRTGQLWGNPLYRWDVLKKDGYSWWIRRLEHNLKIFDFIRIDHFRGLVAYWEVPAGKKTAVVGAWVKVPSEFLPALFRRFPNLPIVAEDLGIITSDVREVISRFNLPGMKVLLFAFGETLPENPYAPHNHVKNCVVYTGTHDNNTSRGWFEREASPGDQRRLFRYIGREVSNENVSWELIRLAMMSVADIAIIPMQDILSLGEEARMNRPGQTIGNYQWRLIPEQMKVDVRLKEMTKIFGRSQF